MRVDVFDKYGAGGTSKRPEADRGLIIVGITGLARSGKDTVAGILCRRFGFTRIGLADGIRSAFRDLDGPTWEAMKELEASGKTSRWALQHLASIAKARSPHVWLDLASAKILYSASMRTADRCRFVIPDVRFPSEAEYLDGLSVELGGRHFVWRVVRPGSGLGGEAGQHISERAMEQIRPDVTITNDGPMEYLESIVANYAEGICGDE